jgi:hypothetical protein
MTVLTLVPSEEFFQYEVIALGCTDYRQGRIGSAAAYSLKAPGV